MIFYQNIFHHHFVYPGDCYFQPLNQNFKAQQAIYFVKVSEKSCSSTCGRYGLQGRVLDTPKFGFPCTCECY